MRTLTSERPTQHIVISSGTSTNENLVPDPRCSLPSTSPQIPRLASSFTPINGPSLPQLLTPPDSAPGPQARHAGEHVRRHHPMVARYLGLGPRKEPSHLASYAPRDPSSPPTPTRSPKRRHKHQTRKVPNKPGVDQVPKLEPQQELTDDEAIVGPKSASCEIGLATKDNAAAKTFSTPDSACRNTFDETVACPSQDICADDGYDEIFRDIVLDAELEIPITNVWSGERTSAPQQCSTMKKGSDKPERNTTPKYRDVLITPPATANKVDGLETLCSMTGKDLAIGLPCKEITSSFRLQDKDSPSARPAITISPQITSCGKYDAEGAGVYMKPIVRGPFPIAAQDGSPIIGLSHKLILRTCFRIGEAINQASQALHQGQDVMIELYAKVVSSQRDAAQQQFILGDLFHDRPPYIQGLYAAGIWKGVQLYDDDAHNLLEGRKLCRCVGSVKRKDKGWVMSVMNIWEADWDDVAWAEGIVKP